jgi:2-iminobutanoate/2-iminopropanoate deaminase
MNGHRGRSTLLTAAVSILVTACGGTTAATAEPSLVARELFGPSHMGYSEASRYGDLVWTAGHLPLDADSTDRFAIQVEMVLDDLEATLEEAGAGFDTVLKTNVYLMSFDDWPVFNDIYVRRVGAGGGLPPRTTVQVAGLGLGRIEIEMVAHVRDR